MGTSYILEGAEHINECFMISAKAQRNLLRAMKQYIELNTLSGGLIKMALENQPQHHSSSYNNLTKYVNTSTANWFASGMIHPLYCY